MTSGEAAPEVDPEPKRRPPGKILAESVARLSELVSDLEAAADRAMRLHDSNRDKLGLLLDEHATTLKSVVRRLDFDPDRGRVPAEESADRAASWGVDPIPAPFVSGIEERLGTPASVAGGVTSVAEKYREIEVAELKSHRRWRGIAVVMSLAAILGLIVGLVTGYARWTLDTVTVHVAIGILVSGLIGYCVQESRRHHYGAQRIQEKRTQVLRADGLIAELAPTDRARLQGKHYLVMLRPDPRLPRDDRDWEDAPDST